MADFNHLNPTQQAFFQDDTPVCIYTGGWGSGKTTVAVLKHAALAVANPGCTSIAVEPTYTMVRDILIPKFLTVFTELMPVRFIWRPSSYSFFLPDYSHTILLRSGDKPKRIEGVETSHVTVDEGALCKDELFTHLRGRIRDAKAWRRQLNIAGTPDGCKGWVYDHAQNPDSKFAYYQASTDENAHNLGDEYMEMLAEMPPDLQAQYRHGEWVDLRTPRVYQEFDRAIHATVKRPLDPTLPSWYWLDFNVNPGMHFCLAQEHGPELWIVEEWFLKRGTTPDVVEAMQAYWDKMGIPGKPRVICDAAGRGVQSATGWSDVDILEQAGFEVDWSYVQSQSDKHNPVRVLLHKKQLHVDPRCRITIDSFLRYTYREGTQKPMDDDFKHMMDSVGYGVMKLRPLRRVKYSRG